MTIRAVISIPEGQGSKGLRVTDYNRTVDLWPGQSVEVHAYDDNGIHMAEIDSVELANEQAEAQAKADEAARAEQARIEAERIAAAQQAEADAQAAATASATVQHDAGSTPAQDPADAGDASAGE